MQTPTMNMPTMETEPAVSGTAVSVREARFSDYDAIAALMEQHGMETCGREDWEHLWIGNPVYEQKGRDWPIGWVLENGDQKVVGFSGNVPVACSFSGSSFSGSSLSGRMLTAAVTSAWVVAE